MILSNPSRSATLGLKTDSPGSQQVPACNGSLRLSAWRKYLDVEGREGSLSLSAVDCGYDNVNATLIIMRVAFAPDSAHPPDTPR